jgi:hypothetical protein
MKACVVYESLYGNTRAVAEAIAEGIGPEATSLPTDAATPDIVAGADLIVAGAPLMAFRLPTEATRSSAGKDASSGHPADLSHPSMRAWLATLPRGTGRAAAFETKLRWSPGGATGTIEKELRASGFQPVARAEKFYVTGTVGPLREGELDRARAWGRQLAAAMGAVSAA